MRSYERKKKKKTAKTSSHGRNKWTSNKSKSSYKKKKKNLVNSNYNLLNYLQREHINENIKNLGEYLNHSDVNICEKNIKKVDKSKNIPCVTSKDINIVNGNINKEKKIKIKQKKKRRRTNKESVCIPYVKEEKDVPILYSNKEIILYKKNESDIINRANINRKNIDNDNVDKNNVDKYNMNHKEKKRNCSSNTNKNNISIENKIRNNKWINKRNIFEQKHKKIYHNMFKSEDISNQNFKNVIIQHEHSSECSNRSHEKKKKKLYYSSTLHTNFGRIKENNTLFQEYEEKQNEIINKKYYMFHSTDITNNNANLYDNQINNNYEEEEKNEKTISNDFLDNILPVEKIIQYVDDISIEALVYILNTLDITNSTSLIERLPHRYYKEYLMFTNNIKRIIELMENISNEKLGSFFITYKEEKDICKYINILSLEKLNNILNCFPIDNYKEFILLFDEYKLLEILNTLSISTCLHILLNISQKKLRYIFDNINEEKLIMLINEVPLCKFYYINECIPIQKIGTLSNNICYEKLYHLHNSLSNSKNIHHITCNLSIHIIIQLIIDLPIYKAIQILKTISLEKIAQCIMFNKNCFNIYDILYKAFHIDKIVQIIIHLDNDVNNINILLNLANYTDIIHYINYISFNKFKSFIDKLPIPFLKKIINDISLKKIIQFFMNNKNEKKVIICFYQLTIKNLNSVVQLLPVKNVLRLVIPSHMDIHSKETKKIMNRLDAKNMVHLLNDLNDNEYKYICNYIPLEKIPNLLNNSTFANYEKCYIVILYLPIRKLIDTFHTLNEEKKFGILERMPYYIKDTIICNIYDTTKKFIYLMNPIQQIFISCMLFKLNRIFGNHYKKKNINKQKNKKDDKKNTKKYITLYSIRNKFYDIIKNINIKKYHLFLNQVTCNKIIETQNIIHNIRNKKKYEHEQIVQDLFFYFNIYQYVKKKKKEKILHIKKNIPLNVQNHDKVRPKIFNNINSAITCISDPILSNDTSYKNSSLYNKSYITKKRNSNDLLNNIKSNNNNNMYIYKDGIAPNNNENHYIDLSKREKILPIKTYNIKNKASTNIYYNQNSSLNNICHEKNINKDMTKHVKKKKKKKNSYHPKSRHGLYIFLIHLIIVIKKHIQDENDRKINEKKSYDINYTTTDNNNNNNNNYNYNNYNNNHNNNHSNLLSNTSSTNHNDYNKFIFYHVRKIMKNIFFSVRKILQMKNRSNVIKNISIFHIMNANLLPYMINENYNNIFYDISNNIKHTEKINHNPNISDNRNHLQEYKIFNMIQDSTEFFDANNTCVVIENEHTNIMDTSKENENIFSLKDDIPIIEDTNNVIEFDNEQIINDICVQKNKNRNPLYYVSLLFNKPNSFPYLIKKNILRIEKNDKRYKNFFFFKTATICDTIKNEECESNTQGDNIKDYILTTSNIFKKNRNNILNIYNKDTKIDNDIDKEESEQINSDNINILYCNTNVESHNNNNNNKNNNKNKNNDRNNNNRKKKDIQKSKFSDLRYKWKFSHISEKYKNKIYKINNNINGEKKNVYCLKFIFVLNNVCDLDKRNNDNINLTLNFFISKKKKKRLLNIYKQKILDSSLDIQINNEKYKNKIINFSTNISDTTCYINSNIVNIKFNKEQKNKLEYLYSLINEEDPSNKNLFNKTKCDTYIKHDGNMNVDNVHYDYKRDDHINNDKYNYNYNYSYNYNYDEKVSFNQLKNNTLDHNENKNNNILSEKFISNLLNKNIILLWSCKNIGYIFLNTDNSLHINIQDISHNLYIQIDKYNYNTHKNYFFNNNNNYKKGTYIFLNRLFVKEKIHFRKLKEAFSKIIENKKQKKKGVCKSLLEENNNENFYKCKDSENKIKYKNVNNVTNKNGSVENNNSLNKYENSTNTDILKFIHINMENNYKSEQNSAEDNMNEDIIYFGDDKYEFFNDTNILEKKNINQKNNEISIIDKQVYHDIDIDKDNYLIQYDKNIKRKNSLIFMNNTNDTCSNNMFYEQSKRDDPINEYYYKHHNSIVVNYFNNVIRESNKILSEKRNNINKQIREEIININEKSIHSLDSNEKEKVHQIISNEYNNIMEHELRKIRNPYLCDMYQFLKYSYTKEEFNIILYLKKRNKKLNKIKDMSNIKMNVSKKIINNGNNIIDVQRNGKFVPHIFNDNHILKLKLVTLVDNELCDYKLYNNKIINNNNNKETLRFEENLRKINLSFHSSHIFASNPFIVSREHFLLDQKTQNNSTAQIIQDNNNNNNNNNNGDRKKENNIYNENQEGIINNNIFVKGINKNTSFYNEKYNIQTQNNKDYKNEMLSLSNISYNEIMIQKCIEKDEVFKNGNNLENSKNLQNEEKSPTIKEKNIPNNNNNNNNNNKNNIYDILDNNLFKGLFIKDDIKLSKRTIQDILTSSDTNNLYKNKAFSNHKEEIQSLNTEQKINKIYIPNYSSDVVRKVSNNFSCINQSTNMPNIFSNSIGNIKRIKEKNKIMQNSNSILSDVSDIFINYNDSNKEVEKNMNSSYFNKLIIPIPGDNVNINFFEKKETHLDDNYININSHEENNINTSHIIKKPHVVSNLNYKNISDNSLKNKLCFEFSKTNHHHNNNNNNNVDDYINNSNNNIYINDTHKNINGIMYNLGFLNLHCLLENKNKHFYLITQGYIKASNYINDQMLIHTKIYNEIFHTKKYIDAKKNTSIISSSFDSVTKQNDKLYCLHKKKRMFCNICGYILKQNFLNDFFFFKIFIVTKRAIFSNHSTINIIYQSPLIKAVFHEKDNIKYKLEQTNNNQYILKIIAIKKKKIHKTFSLSKNKHFRKCLEIELINTEKKNIENEMYERKENVLDKKIYGKQVFHKKSFDNLYNTTKDSLIINNEKYKSEVKKKKYSSYENIKNYSQSLSNTSYSNHLSTSICKANKAILNFSILDDKNKK
ncbi:hypothetical protein PFNF135_04535 [Plasmodium falciparum NF135/5.C10]|uniref:Uncharacterized protein n=1 Tax=Plasmodium falciparum NF135/5.C10 TaxID=1036726 RepID=W4ICM5_PLAFA|nr:hypothetical protein PFNF135_04535 [Plasmodium falciparum NF135/5.C10]